jgi:archaellum component FlaC
MNTVELSVRTQLQKIIDELDTLSKKGKDTSDAMTELGHSVGKSMEGQIKKTETMFGRIRGLAGSTAKAMGDDFKNLFNVAGLAQGLKLGGIFSDNIKETMALTDTIRKLGGIFGIAQGEFVSFQKRMVDGLAEVGLGADAASNALKGLSETQVRGQENLIAYAKASGMLASVSGQKGQEGSIAKGIATTITAGGGNVNDPAVFARMVDAMRKSFNATGQNPTQILATLAQIMEKMPADLRKNIGPEGLVDLASIGQVAGKNATAFLEEYLSKSPIARKHLEARGFGGVFDEKGLNVDKFRKQAKNIFAQFGGDPRLMAQTLGLSEDAAEGFVRLYESLDKVSKVQQKMRADTKQLEDQYKSAMTMSEAFAGSLNKVKSSFSGPIAAITNGLSEALVKAMDTSLTDLGKYLPKALASMLQKAQEKAPDALGKNIGSTAVVVGGGVLTALLAGGGIKRLFGGIVGAGNVASKAKGVAESEIYSQITGKQVTPVYVTNVSEFSALGGGLNTSPVGGGGKLAVAGKIAAAGGLGYVVGDVLNSLIEGTGFDKALTSFVQEIAADLDPNVQRARAKQVQAEQETSAKVIEKSIEKVKDAGLISEASSFESIVRTIVENKAENFRVTSEVQRGPVIVANYPNNGR